MTDSEPQPASTQPITNNTADPEEVDISNHNYERVTAARPRIPQQQSGHDGIQLTDDQLRAMMLSFPPNASGTATPPQPGYNPFFPGTEPEMGAPNVNEDPMLKLLRQMMGGVDATGSPGAGGMPSFPGMPPPAMSAIPGQAQDPAAIDPSAYIWRIIHAGFALALGLYIAFTADFTGTKLERDLSAVRRNAVATEASGDWGQNSIRFFYIFATAEIILQTSRFYLEKGLVQTGGILGIIMGFLPQPWKGYLALVLRYGRIWTTVSGDAMVCVFVLGVCSWLRAA